MKPISAKNKGKRFESYVAAEIVKAGLGQAKREIGSGSGKLKGDIWCNLDSIIECKNQKKLNWWRAIRQAKLQAQKSGIEQSKWSLIIRDPKTAEANPEVYTLMDFWEWLKLQKKNQETLIKEPDREFKYRLQKLVYSAKEVLKSLEDA